MSFDELEKSRMSIPGSFYDQTLVCVLTLMAFPFSCLGYISVNEHVKIIYNTYDRH